MTLNNYPNVIAYGGGVNSTAMLCGMRERGIVPSLITFADTGGEHPHTYEHVNQISAICKIWWGIEITVVRMLFQGEFEGLEKNCIRKKMLPSLAYGRKGCSMKYKVDPQTKELKRWMSEKGISDAYKFIGYDAGEGHRQVGKSEMKHSKNRTEHFKYPLIEWLWKRRECEEAIKRMGLPIAHKSACFFCPASKRAEIITLKQQYPDLYSRAIALESNAVTRKNIGLTGGDVKWSDIVENDEAQGKLWEWAEAVAETKIPCGCFDG